MATQEVRSRRTSGGRTGTQHRLVAHAATRLWGDLHAPAGEVAEILANHLRLLGGAVHLSLQLLDLQAVLLQSVADGPFQVVDENKIRKEGKDVLQLQQAVCLLQEAHHVSYLVSRRTLGFQQDDMLGDHQPKLPSHPLVVDGHVSHRLGQVQIHLQRQRHRLLVHALRGIQVAARAQPCPL
eukprot:scaffold670_cov333-Pavlova_lutheri.AAC.25